MPIYAHALSGAGELIVQLVHESYCKAGCGQTILCSRRAGEPAPHEPAVFRRTRERRRAFASASGVSKTMRCCPPRRCELHGVSAPGARGRRGRSRAQGNAPHGAHAGFARRPGRVRPDRAMAVGGRVRWSPARGEPVRSARRRGQQAGHDPDVREFWRRDEGESGEIHSGRGVQAVGAK